MKCKILGILKKNCFSAVSTEGDNHIVVTEGDIENITIDIEKEIEAFAEWCADSLYEYIGGNRWKSYDLNRIATTTQLRELWEKERRAK